MASSPLDLKNIQGDILSVIPPLSHPLLLTIHRAGGLPKKSQIFYFFQIDKNHIQDFRIQLKQFIPLITSNAQSVSDHDKIAQHKKNGDKSLLKLSGVNISFSQKGLAAVSQMLGY